MKKIIEGLIGVMLFTGSVVFANNNVPAKHNVHPKTPACTHCTKTSCALGSKETAASNSKSTCPKTANCVCPNK